MIEFDQNLVYPSDSTGSYIELCGEVVAVQNTLSNFAVSVETKFGIIIGYTNINKAPQIGYFAKIRVYDSGGGWYPDNIVTSWSKEKSNLEY